MMNFKKAVKDFQRERIICGLKVTLPEPPKDITTIGNYGELEVKRRKFHNPPREIVDEINYKFRNNIPLIQSEKDFIKEENEKCINGYWFFRNNSLEWVTGEHYFYLAYWVMPVLIQKDGEFVEDVTTPIFRDSDRDNEYFWWHCVNDPKCYGMLELTNRRDGKTARGLKSLYYGITRKERSKGGIQSKTDGDAEEAFDKLIDSWRDMFEPFKPIDIGIDPPKKELNFDKPQQRGKKASTHKSKLLRSKINFRSSNPESYDGYRMYRYLRDEAGKGKQDPKKTWYTVKEAQAIGKVIVGKARITTTSEDMEAVAGKKFKELWEESDVTRRLPNGETESGLYRYFKPADYGFMGDDDNTEVGAFIDEWGDSNRESAKRYLQDYVLSLRPENRLSRLRKYPLEIDHCFYLPNDSSVLPIYQINQQLRFVVDLKERPYESGNFYWADRDKEVRWHSDEKGKFKVTWLPNPEDRNRYAGSGIHKYPTRTEIVIGVDPIDNSDKIADDARKSNAAAYAIRKTVADEGHPAKEFIIQYLYRPATPEEFWEDMIMMSHFCSCYLLVETNKIGMVNYFRQRGYYHYLMDRPSHMHTDWSSKHQKEVGMPNNSKAVQNSLIEQTQAYIYDNVGWDDELETMKRAVMFEELLEDWTAFNPNNWTPHDCFVAAAYAIAAAKESPKRRNIPIATSIVPKSSFWRDNKPQ